MCAEYKQGLPQDYDGITGYPGTKCPATSLSTNLSEYMRVGGDYIQKSLSVSLLDLLLYLRKKIYSQKA